MKASREALNETYSVLDQVCKIAQNPVTTDINHIAKFFAHKKEIAALVEQREQRIKASIEEYQTRVRELQNRGVNPNTRKLLLQKELVQGEITDVQRRLDAYSEQIEEDESIIKDLQNQIQTVEQEQKSEEHESSAQLPVAESHLRLYKSICPIKFDPSMLATGPSRTTPSQQPTWDNVKGAAYLITVGEVKPFELTRQSPTEPGSGGLSRAELANRIWDMLWDEHVANRQSQQEQQQLVTSFSELSIAETE